MFRLVANGDGKYEEVAGSGCRVRGDGFVFGGYVQEWRGLPAGYTQVEYIESTGSQYIDTSVVPGTTTAVDFKFNLVAYESGKAFFGQQPLSVEPAE